MSASAPSRAAGGVRRQGLVRGAPGRGYTRPLCARGGIGRRARLRALWTALVRGGSSPLGRIEKALLSGAFSLSACVCRSTRATVRIVANGNSEQFSEHFTADVRTKEVGDELQQIEGRLGGPLARRHRAPALQALRKRGDGAGSSTRRSMTTSARSAEGARQGRAAASTPTRPDRARRALVLQARRSDGVADEQARLHEREGRARRQAAADRADERGEVRQTRESFGEYWERWLARRKPYLEPGTWQGYEMRRTPAAAAGPRRSALGRLEASSTCELDGRAGRGDRGRRARAEDG